MNGVEKLSIELINNLYTASDLKRASLVLEALAQSPAFKKKALAIVNSQDLTPNLKKQQLINLLKDINMPLVVDFFKKVIDREDFWVFDSKQFDYFDQFVQYFQLKTEDVLIVNLVTQVEVKYEDQQRMSDDLTESLKKKVLLHVQVNPKILGGAQVRVGNLVFDYSLRSKFRQFQREWLKKFKVTSDLTGRA